MLSESTFRFEIRVPREIVLQAAQNPIRLSREDFFSFLWSHWGDSGLVGIHEGTLLSEDAATLGLETESWTIDSGEAPRERDWVGHSKDQSANLYFETDVLARDARAQLIKLGIDCGEVNEQEPQDWDAEWKASFTGVQVAPDWDVLPPWVDKVGQRRVLRINPGAGFGTGTHETTQLCMQLLSEQNQRKSLKGARVLDFGSGSGILSIAAGILGAQVEGVEIDPLAIDNAQENLSLNGKLPVRFLHSLNELNAGQKYDVIVANILKPVLLQFVSELCNFAHPDTVWILSGLMEPDVSQVESTYLDALKSHKADIKSQVLSLGEWRALCFR